MADVYLRVVVDLSLYFYRKSMKAIFKNAFHQLTYYGSLPFVDLCWASLPTERVSRWSVLATVFFENERGSGNSGTRGRKARMGG